MWGRVILTDSTVGPSRPRDVGEVISRLAIDGELVALDDDGRPSFNILQNYGSSQAPVLYFL